MERIQCPAPLPENPAIPLLTKMLVPAPYQAPEKKAKETRSGLRRKGTSDVTFEDAETHSSHTEDDEEEEESNSPLEGEEEKGGLHASGGRGVQEGEGFPRRQLRVGHRQ